MDKPTCLKALLIITSISLFFTLCYQTSYWFECKIQKLEGSAVSKICIEDQIYNPSYLFDLSEIHQLKSDL